MSRGEEKAKRQWWRPRFSLRTLAIVVTLLCAYFAAWEATKRLGVTAVSKGKPGHDSPFPLIVRRTAYNQVLPGGYNAVTYAPLPTTTKATKVTNYHLWFFGPTIKLPF